MKILIFTMFCFVFATSPALSAESVFCTIEKSLTTGDFSKKPMTSIEQVSIKAIPFVGGHIISLSPADVECEIRAVNPKAGTLINCWTLDKKHGFRSDRTSIDKDVNTTNTVTYADAGKKLVVQIIVNCK